MKPGVKRDLKLVLSLLAVFLVAGGLAWTVTYLNAGSLPADQQARDLYAAGLRRLFAVFSMVGVGVISIVYLSKLDWFARRGDHDPSNRAAPTRTDSYLPSLLGWGILLGVVVIVGAILLTAALSGH
jgi:hypothetical protein